MKKNLLITLFFGLILQFSFAQTAEVRGTIISSEGNEPIPGVSVLVKGTTVGTVSDIDGNYTVDVPASAETLVFSFIGLRTQEVEIGGRSVIDVVMESDVRALNEVVVTALGVSREESSLGFAIQSIDGDKLSAVRETNVVGALAGKVAGVQVIGSSGAALG